MLAHDEKPVSTLALMLAGLISSMAAAQSNAPERGLDVIPPPIDAETVPERLPTLETMPLPDDVVLPDVPEAYARGVTAQTVFVSRVDLTGNTVLAPSEIDAIVNDYTDRDLAFEDLQELRNRLTQAYVQRGYVSSGVVLRDQEVINGTVRMEAHEGSLDDIKLRGNKRLRNRYIESRLRADTGPVLNVYELENSLRLMQQWPQIDQINAQVVPGPERGTSVLDLNVRENKGMTLAAGYNNHRPPSVGEDQGTLSFSHSSLTKNGDYLLANYALTEGLNDIYVAYGIPLTASDLTLEGHYSDGDSDIIESPFADLDIASATKRWGVKLIQPMYRTLNHNVTVGLAFENIESESFLLGQRFSFAPGESLGESEVSAVRLSAGWNWKRLKDSIVVSAIVSRGVDWLDATDNSDATDSQGNPVEDLPDSEFTAALFHAQYARRLPWWGVQIRGRVTGQWASDPLLPVERLAIGGARTVRGYRENQLVRDNGIIASAEFRIPIWVDDAGESKLGLTLVPFFDFGVGKDNEIGLPGLDDPTSDELMSVGGGLIWNWWEPLYAEVYYGEDLEDVNNVGDSLQDDGLHVLAILQWSF